MTMGALRRRYGRAGRGRIEDTGLLPYAVADSVLEEAERHTGLSVIPRHALVEQLSAKADAIYNRNARFRQQIQGASGREILWSFMRHWASAELRTSQPTLYSKLPDSFKVGRVL